MIVIYSALFFSISVISHSIVQRYIKSNSVISFTIISSFLGLILFWKSYSDFFISIQSLSILFSYFFMCELYIFFFTLIMSSISANIILDLGFDKKIKISNEITNYEKMVDARVTRLLNNKFLIETDGVLSITNKGKVLNRSFFYMKNFFRHKNLISNINI